jgi:hypothetical protein
MPEAVDTIDKKIMGKLNNFKNRMNNSEIKEAAPITTGSPHQPARMPKQMAIVSQRERFLIGGAQQAWCEVFIAILLFYQKIRFKQIEKK